MAEDCSLRGDGLGGALPGSVDPARLLWLELRPGGLDRVQGELHAPSR